MAETSGFFANAKDLEGRELGRIVYVLLKGGGISVRAIDSSLRDPIAVLVVEAILVRGTQSISEIAEYVRDKKGSSSRTTVRQRVRTLHENGTLYRLEESQEWALTERFLHKCWMFLSHVGAET